ncbi:non-homologous end-joining DNA ligase [Pseudonocardia parietis]|uniref:DNA ligase (ATP) n=1 Tax=Pseudonocardia parietis TaxID=570936 RepID=A0ABS4W374_9PSEU|nr:non-homologous end-joining DNA ligase [Pseudonocardia parietis]MBP2370663.1 DNA ligase D-like protein (predicted ligase)/DNA ligase D-like protein (predicted polymerase)/DNA ligase D-like protein (predicted 3'-phosphoesterase) [Pseudonocardia parietis]
MADPGEGDLPAPLSPMLAVAGDPPTGAGWAFEFKWDGIRAVVAVAGDRVRITTRNGNDVTSAYPDLAEGVHADRPLLLDGEIIASDAAGRPDFGLLQQRMHVAAPGARLLAEVGVSYVVFDLLVDGDDRLVDEPYDARRERLSAVGADGWPRMSVPAAFTDVAGDQVLRAARENGLEGVVAKRRDAPYEPGRRSHAWTKTALLRTQEVLIGGWRPGNGRRSGSVGSLLLGAHDEQGRLRFLGHVGTGFTEAMLGDLLERLEPLRRRDSPFDETVPREHARRARWVDPRLVGEVEYRRLTTDGRLRHAAWRGLRPDREPPEVRLTAQAGDTATPAPAGDATAFGPAGDSAGPDERLAPYLAKRDLDVTPEPGGGEPGTGPPIFVVQRHRASRLHYDLRLEVGGALASWAVPRGPTLDPDVRRMAVQVEDHPIDYAGFEGVIPAGQYGGGSVVVWDRGTWTPADGTDPEAALERGELHFDLHGDKLAGRFALVRRGRSGSGEQKQWLLVHKHDEHAVVGWDAEDHRRSVLSGRTTDEVAAAPSAMWQGDAPARHAELPLGADAGSGTGPVTEDELAALDALGVKGTWRVGGHEVALTNLDKTLFPGTADAPPTTKRDLVRYHAMMAPHLLPYLAGRPVNLHRYPDGVDRPGFWQKEVPEHAPDWVRRWHNVDADPGETRCYAVLDHVAALVWAANYGAVELHPWTSRLPDVRQPTWALIDIDPGSRTGFDDVLVLARLYRTALQHLDLAAAPKVTGQRGIQIWVPIEPGYTFDDTRAWVERLSRAVGRTAPELVSWEWHTDRRKGLARLDYTQNAINKTLVAPFSPRPASHAPVSMPVTWDHLDDPDLRPDRWTVRTAAEHLAEAGDPLAPLIDLRQRLPTL